VAEKKSRKKDKDKSRQHASLCLSLKREKTSTTEARSNKRSQLVSHDLAFHKCVNILLTQTENDVLMSSFKGEIMTDWLELQSHAMAATHLPSNEFVESQPRRLKN